MERVWVVGGPGSGKTTTARLIAERLDAPHIELDSLWWDAEWTPAGDQELRRRLAARLAVSDRWVVDGNYLDEVAPVLLPPLDTIVWLQSPRRVAVGRAIWRSTRRAVGRKQLWNDNRESLGVLSPRSLVRLWQRWPEYDKHIGEARDAHPEVRVSISHQRTRSLCGSSTYRPSPTNLVIDPRSAGRLAPVSDTYADVDASSAPAAAVDWQQHMATWPAIAAYKRRTWELLANAEPILDVGCGPGDDVLALGAQRCVGVDRSAAMCTRARERGATVVQGGAEVLPFADSTFAGARSDRTLQHVDDPKVALHELLRVVQPGASVVVADPDQESLVIQVPGVRQSVLDRLKALRRDIGYRNGRWISKAPSILEQLGAEVTSVDTFPLVIRHPTDAFGLPTWPDRWRSEGGFSEDEIAEWDRAIADPGPGFLYSLTFLVVAARKG